ncbi:MAG: OmpW family outer membrane protein [Oxalicibacterium faecigallinarum]|uniref:OmpW/AlkL family protein n=1 Tax=Oxalicibacterium faecigallinarum TaxID=573741 RepID=UPI00280754E5|nr:OmpW family outer membrane protein [Oxalicibacterium faecigallinarum]MDQ7969264.1 OmpW family outer membrane protein [Oxalicibacterium faecigallinarum]
MNRFPSPRMVPRFVAFSFLSALTALSLPAAAQTAGSNVVNIGWFHLYTDDSSQPLRQTSPGSTTFAGSGATVSSADTLGIAYTRFVTDNFAVTLDAGIPPKFKLDGEGTLGPAGRLGTAKQWSPAIVAKWFFGEADAKWRPFIGLGVTHVWYSDVKLSPSLVGIVAGPGGSAHANLSSSWAPVANVGVRYNLDEKWSIGFSLSYIPLDTDAEILGRTAGGTNTRHVTNLTLDPYVSFLSVGYKF